MVVCVCVGGGWGGINDYYFADVICMGQRFKVNETLLSINHLV